MTCVYRQQELPLGAAAPEWPQPRREPTLDERFEAFHASHPWIFEALEELTAQWVRDGGGQIGIKALFELLRWSSPRLAGGEPFRLNNNYTSRYARLLCARHPEWAGVFQLRSLRAGGDE
ncbi:hypothetical protein GCM10010307_70450 [Streptomyces vastus]|uniref:Uncharacterized protein n=1 Tax=Streptomyces vastus TaxID=285451 RepID=A0ABN3RMY8_9ACTN